MDLLKTINPEHVDEHHLAGWAYRKAARAVVFDQEHRVGLLHVRRQGYYKLPGGGLEEGEAIPMALVRECAEELGVQVEVIKELGRIVEYRAQFKLQQPSYGFLAKTRSDKQAPQFTDEEKASEFEVVWVAPSEALRCLNLNQTADYGGKLIEERDFCFLTKTLQAAEGLESFRSAVEVSGSRRCRPRARSV